MIAKQCRLLDPSRLWFIDDLRLGRKEPNMMIIGVDYHPSFQTIAFFMEETWESDGGEDERPPGIHAGSCLDRISLLFHHCGSVPVHHTHQSLPLKMQSSE